MLTVWHEGRQDTEENRLKSSRQEGGRAEGLTLVSPQISLELYSFYVRSVTIQYFRTLALKSENLGLNLAWN